MLALLADILRPDLDPATTGAMRLRLMGRQFSWQALVDLARAHGVLLPFIFALNRRTLLPPIPRSIGNHHGHVTVKLEAIYRQHLARRQAERSQLEAIIGILGEAGIRPLLLKGARYIAEPVGPWCEARSMSDFDILVKPCDAQRAFASIQAAGYREDAGGAFLSETHVSHHLPALWQPGEPAALEIHTDALTIAGQRSMNTQHVWALAELGCDGYLVLPWHWHALHGLLHHQVQDGGHAQRTFNLKGLWEWTMLAREFTEGDWDAIAGHMCRTGAPEVLESWLMQSYRLFGFEAPILGRISRTSKNHAEATFRHARKPYWIRRSACIADQLRSSFGRETLARKYGIPASQVSLWHAGKNLADLLRRHRGKLMQRVTGYGMQL
jgi:Uncharacterised nucleotidyltransferase